MKISKGVIAAAGLGSRFLPYVKAVTKNLVPILNKPQIQYVVEEFLAAGIDQILIVHNHGDPSIKRYFTPDRELEKKLKESGKEQLLDSLKFIWQKVKVIKFLPQPRTRLPYGNATPVLVAKSFLGQQPFVYAFGDDMVIEDQKGQFLAHMIKIFEKYQPSVVLGAQWVPTKEVPLYGTIQYQNDPQYPNRMVKIIEKPAPDQILSNNIQFGRFVFSPKIFQVLDKLPIRNNELWLTDANNILAQTGIAIAEPIKNGFWITTGDPQRWLLTNIALAWKDPNLRPTIKKFLATLGKS